MKTRRFEKMGTWVGMVFGAIALIWIYMAAAPSGVLASESNFGDDSNGTFYNEMQNDTVSVVLMGVADYEVTEMFNDILKQSPGVLETKRVRLHIDPSRPRACYATWSVRMDNPDLFELESNIYRTIKDIVSKNADAPAVSFSFAPTDKNLETLSFIRPWESSSNEIAFLLNRPLPHELKHANRGFARHCYRSFGYHPQTWGDTGFE
jgi:hypothetical protein